MDRKEDDEQWVSGIRVETVSYSMVMRLAFLYLQHLCISTTMLCAVATHFRTASVFIEIDVKVMVS